MKKEIIIAMPDMGNDLFRKYMKSKYVKSIERAGGKVVTIELSDKATAAKKRRSLTACFFPAVRISIRKCITAKEKKNAESPTIRGIPLSRRFSKNF